PLPPAPALVEAPPLPPALPPVPAPPWPPVPPVPPVPALVDAVASATLVPGRAPPVPAVLVGLAPAPDEVQAPKMPREHPTPRTATPTRRRSFELTRSVYRKTRVSSPSLPEGAPLAILCHLQGGSMRFQLTLIVAALFVPACASSAGGGSGDCALTACTWPSSLDATDAAPDGQCHAERALVKC